ncbi:Arm DNA-binding domain-containing protein [Variovorax sp. R-27]|uniref:Arm DNA-binding domain-containing protein n=1 Tax=Variovorax sp. R-27 TaxID=3404058 RepID=UPI003CEAFBE0
MRPFESGGAFRQPSPAKHQSWHQSWYFRADTMTLTVKAIDAAKPREKAYKLADAHGLYLYVSPTGAKSWRTTRTETTLFSTSSAECRRHSPPQRAS